MSADGDRKNALFIRCGIWGFAGVALAAVFLPTGLKAHSGAHGVVMDRMEIMISHDEARAAIENMLFGDADYDAQRIQAYAKAIADQSGDALTKLFPEDSLHQPSLALPAIWQDWEAFKALAQELKRNAETLEEAAARYPAKSSQDTQPQVTGDITVEQAFEALGDTCNSCHLKFRQR